jgi:hypothetical protein
VHGGNKPHATRRAVGRPGAVSRIIDKVIEEINDRAVLRVDVSMLDGRLLGVTRMKVRISSAPANLITSAALGGSLCGVGGKNAGPRTVPAPTLRYDLAVGRRADRG